jgi:peptide/nickel transport system ATP-binding protein
MRQGDKGMADVLLDVTDLQITYGSRGSLPVVSDVSFRVENGKRVAIVGESGSGKSTIASSILGLLTGGGRVTGGTISFMGKQVANASEYKLRKLRGRRIGYIPQDPMSNLNPVLRIGTQMKDVLRIDRSLRRSLRWQRAAELLTESGIQQATARLRQYPHEFSGGMRQRVLIATGMACAPALLIADEPTSALDVTVQRQILESLNKLIAERETALLFITHDLGLAAEQSDWIIVMAKGRVVEQGPPGQILRTPRHEYTKRLIAAAPGLISVREPAREPVRRETAKRPDPLLELEEVVKKYALRGQRGALFPAMNGVSLSVRRGATTAIVGESGSGKTTMTRLVLGQERPTSGQIRFDGQDYSGMTGHEWRRLRRSIQPVFQDPYGSLDPSFTVLRSILEPMNVDRELSRTARRARAYELLDQVALPDAVASRTPSELSGGQRQRVALARALALKPRLVVLDEAVSALDVLVQEQVMVLLKDLQRDLGLSYLFVTHDLALVREFADDVVVLRAGEVVEQGPADRVFQDPRDPYTRQLIECIPGFGILDKV